MRHLRLVGPDDQPPPAETLFDPGPPAITYPPELRQLTDQLHDAGYLELGQAVLIQYRRYDRLLTVAQKLLRPEGGDAA